MSKAVIAIKDLSFSYDKTPVLENVSISIEEGEFVGIFGPNGGGKTTLLKIILGMLRARKGEVRLLGLSPKDSSKQIGYVPQILRFDRDFPISVIEVIMMGSLSKLSLFGRYTKEHRQKALEALEKVGLAELAHRSFGTLSGGQAQRVLIARAIVDHPAVLLLDEPTASVDLQAEEAIHKLLKTLNEKMTIVMVTHDLQTITHRADRLLCVNRTVSSMRAKEVCEHFALGLYHSPLISGDHFKF